MPRHPWSALVTVALTLASSILMAQRGPTPDPLVKENATVKLGPHTYVIPDNNVGDGSDFMTITGVQDLAREGIDERQFRLGFRLVF